MRGGLDEEKHQLNHESITCNACNLPVGEGLSFGLQPIANQLLSNRGDVASKYPLGIKVCRNCGLVQLAEPLDSSLFYENYATPSSWKAEPHSSKLLDELEQLLPKDARVLDVGCNDGVFLGLLRDRGWSRISGIEPTDNTAAVAGNRGHRVIHGRLTSTLADELTLSEGKWDCLVLRQVLEHIVDLRDFGKALSILVKPGGLLVVEVPDARVNLLNGDYGVWEEHANYFTPEVLANLLGNYGFEVQRQYESLFSSVCLTVIARRKEGEYPSSGVNNRDDGLAADSGAMFDRWASDFASVKARIQDWVQSVSKDSQIVLYGVGCRSTNFVNIMGLGPYLSAVVDAQEGKQGKYVPGFGLEILKPGDITELGLEAPTVLLGVNAENEQKVIDSSPFSAGSWVSVLPPSPRLIPGWPKY